MSGLPPIPGVSIVHGHREGEPCNRFCHYRGGFWLGIKTWLLGLTRKAA